MLICEIGLPPQVLDELSQVLIDQIIIYKGVKNVAEYGGDWQP